MKPKLKLCAIAEIPVFALGLPEIPAFQLLLSGRKQEDFYFFASISESESKIDAQENVLPAFFLTVVTGMPVFPAVLRRKQDFRFLHKVSVSVSLNP